MVVGVLLGSLISNTQFVSALLVLTADIEEKSCRKGDESETSQKSIAPCQIFGFG